MILKRKVVVALLAVSAFAGAGCGDDDDEGTAAPATTTAEETAKAPSKLAIEVGGTAKKVSFTAPTSAQAGAVEVTLTNATKGNHEAQLVRVDGAQTAQDVLEVVEAEDGKIPEWMHGAGGPADVGPGEAATATTILEPGKYYVIDAGDSKPEAEPVSLTVEGSAAGAELPETDARIEAKDYTFVTSGLKAGKNTVRIDNTGKELHHVLAFPMRKGVSFAEVRKAFTQEEEPEGPPPVDFENGSGTTVLDGGTAENVEFDLKAGKYALVCFITDRAGGPPHVAKGMLTELVVQ